MVNDYLKYCFYLYLKMSNSENNSSEVFSERKEMKGPSFSFDPKLFLKKDSEVKEDSKKEKYCSNDSRENNQKELDNQQEAILNEELDARQKLRQKLQMKRMMRQNKGNLKRMLDSKLKS